MNNKEFTVRKMINSEFKSRDDIIKRDEKGALCHFAVEASSGAAQIGLSREQAYALAEVMNNYVLEAA